MRDEVKCCMTCKHCGHDFSTDAIWCNNETGEWIHQEEENILTPQYDYCTEWEKDIEAETDFWQVACTLLSKEVK